MFDTAAQAVTPMVVPRDELARANGWLSAAEMTMGRFAGPPLGGLLVGVAMALAFAGSAAAYLVAALALALLSGHFRSRPDGLPASRLRADIAEGLRYLFICAAPLLTSPVLVAAVFALTGILEMCWDITTVSLRQRSRGQRLNWKSQMARSWLTSSA